MLKLRREIGVVITAPPPLPSPLFFLIPSLLLDHISMRPAHKKQTNNETLPEQNFEAHDPVYSYLMDIRRVMRAYSRHTSGPRKGSSAGNRWKACTRGRRKPCPRAPVWFPSTCARVRACSQYERGSAGMCGHAQTRRKLGAKGKGAECQGASLESDRQVDRGVWVCAPEGS